MSNIYKNPDAVTQIAASDTHPLTFTDWERAPGWLGVVVSELVVIGYKGFLIIGCLLSALMMCTQHITTNIYHVFKANVTPLEQNTRPYKSHSHIKIDFIPLRITTNTRHVQPVNLCSRDTASYVHAFPSRLLATSITVSKTSRGRCVH